MKVKYNVYKFILLCSSNTHHKTILYLFSRQDALWFSDFITQFFTLTALSFPIIMDQFVTYVHRCFSNPLSKTQSTVALTPLLMIISYHSTEDIWKLSLPSTTVLLIQYFTFIPKHTFDTQFYFLQPPLIIPGIHFRTYPISQMVASKNDSDLCLHRLKYFTEKYRKVDLCILRRHVRITCSVVGMSIFTIAPKRFQIVQK